MRHAAHNTKIQRFTVVDHPELDHPRLEQPHEGTRTEAPNGHGTITGWPPGRTLDRPVLDGSTQGPSFEHDVDNPWRGVADPALVTHPEWGKKSQRPRFFWWRKKRLGW